MVAPRQLSRPPITEALVDLRFLVDEPITAERLLSLKPHLENEFPKIEQKRALEAHFRVEEGKLLPPAARDLGFQGMRLISSDETRIVQFRTDGYTFNNVKSYLGGDVLVAEALRIWEPFAKLAEPTAVTRIALRYLNRLELPMKSGELFSQYLTSPPELPDEAPQKISSFLSRVVGHDESGAIAIVSQKLEMSKTAPPVPVLIDVEVFLPDTVEPTVDSLRPFLHSLRSLKNRVFFSLITEETVKLYL